MQNAETGEDGSDVAGVWELRGTESTADAKTQRRDAAATLTLAWDAMVAELIMRVSVQFVRNHVRGVLPSRFHRKRATWPGVSVGAEACKGLEAASTFFVRLVSNCPLSCFHEKIFDRG